MQPVGQARRATIGYLVYKGFFLSGMIINIQYLKKNFKFLFFLFRNKIISAIFTKMQSQAYGVWTLLSFDVTSIFGLC